MIVQNHLYEKLKGRKLTKEHREKLKIAAKNRVISQSLTGRKLSEEIIDKMQEIRKGKTCKVIRWS